MTRNTLRLGFVPLTDCAPIAVAHELGFFRKYGLNVRLHRELGWITVRDKILYGELDAAHAVAGMPFAATLGLGGVKRECVTGLVLNLHGNAITISNDLARQAGKSGGGLRAFIAETHSERQLAFGVVSQFSSHYTLMRQWLMAAGVNPDTDVRLVVVPPPQMVTNLKAGHLDGFCAGEPWNSVALEARAGWVVATSADLDPGHPEKVLMVRREFAEERAPEHEALIAALLDACEFCDQPENREEIVRLLAARNYVGVSPAALRAGLSGEIRFGDDAARNVPDFFVFHRHHTNEPSGDKAARVMHQLRASGFAKEATALTPALARRVFRADLFERACALRAATLNPNENENIETQLTPV